MDINEIAAFYVNKPEIKQPIIGLNGSVVMDMDGLLKTQQFEPEEKKKRQRNRNPSPRRRISEDDLALAWMEYSNPEQYTSMGIIGQALGFDSTVLRRWLMEKYGYAYGVMARRRSFGGDLYHKFQAVKK